MSHSVSSLRFAALALVAAAQAACFSSTATSPSGDLDAADKGDVGGGPE